jgi:hypothetical protein
VAGPLLAPVVGRLAPLPALKGVTMRPLPPLTPQLQPQQPPAADGAGAARADGIAPSPQ